MTQLICTLQCILSLLAGLALDYSILHAASAADDALQPATDAWTSEAWRCRRLKRGLAAAAWLYGSYSAALAAAVAAAAP
eukprot:CAMPEP_0179856256 /NCGR_PEP_ID=MMETSP0982-20121206/11032_1 /TAXON_ID=483367 /ORGANISM="non described non described, Strain CCMP 2436" /LENGTH=79 /DNA_ID=CAMNT_0021742521 /DNA_START=16 /DNA_END=256 /DNA_ORIENTATION=+